MVRAWQRKTGGYWAAGLRTNALASGNQARGGAGCTGSGCLDATDLPDWIVAAETAPDPARVKVPNMIAPKSTNPITTSA